MSACLSLTSAFAQNEVSGQIYFTGDSSLLSGVKVELNGFKSQLSDASGKYSFSAIPDGAYPLIVSHPNYGIQRKQLNLSGNTKLTIDFYLKEGTMDLPEMVVSHVTLTGGEQGIKELPGSAYYLSPKEIEKFNFTDINRALRSVPGVNIQEEEGFGSRPNIGLRGTGVERSSKITLMEDGILIAPAPYAAPAAYYVPSFGRMQGLEVLKGSSQIKYGPYTTGGAINMISTQIPDTLTARVRLAAGSYGFRNLHTFAGNAHEYFAYSVEAFQAAADGFKHLDNGASTGFNKTDYLFKFRVNTKKNAKVYQALSLKFGEANEHADETYLGLTKEDFERDPFYRYAGSQMDEINTKQRQFVATHYIKPAKFLTLTTSLYRTEFFRNWYKLDALKDSTGAKVSIADLLEEPDGYNDAFSVLNGTSGTGSSKLTVKGNSRDHWAMGLQTQLGVDFNTGFIRHDIDLGFRYHQDEQDRFQYQDEYVMTDGVMYLTKAGLPGTESNRLAFARAAATYLQYKLLIKQLSITAGIRHEHIYIQSKDFGKNDPDRTGVNLKKQSNEVDALMPGISLDYKINRKLAAFAGLHKGFTPPGATEGAMPEESYNYEAGVKFYSKGISAQVVGFYNDYRNLLGSDMAATGGTGTGDLYNGGKAQIHGLEAFVMYDVLSHFSTKFLLPLTVSYTYTDAFFKTDFVSTFEDWNTVVSGDRLPYLAQHQLALNLSLEHARFALNFSSKYVSDMRAEAGQGAIPENVKIPAHFVMDAGVQYHFNRHFTGFATVTNLADQVYVVALRPSGYRSGMPRAFQIGLKARL